jgi:flagellin-like protein
MMLNKMRKNAKALSPIFATLILIAIAVIAGIVVYMFTSGTIGSMTSGGTAAQEKAAVQGVGAITGTGCKAYASYVSGGNPIAINGAIVKDSNGDSAVATAVSGGPLTTDGALMTITVTVPLTSGHTYSLTLTSAKGGSFVSSSFTYTAP